MSLLKYSYKKKNQFKVRYVYVRYHRYTYENNHKTVNNTSQTNNGPMQFDKNQNYPLQVKYSTSN